MSLSYQNWYDIHYFNTRNICISKQLQKSKQGWIHHYPYVWRLLACEDPEWKVYNEILLWPCVYPKQISSMQTICNDTDCWSWSSGRSSSDGASWWWPAVLSSVNITSDSTHWVLSWYWQETEEVCHDNHDKCLWVCLHNHVTIPDNTLYQLETTLYCYWKCFGSSVHELEKL